MRKIIHNRDSMVQQDKRHFDRRTYYLQASELVKQVQDKAEIHSRSLISVQTSELLKKIKNKFENWGGYICEKLEWCSKLYLYETSWRELNNIESVTASILGEIKQGRAYLIVGNGQVSELNELCEFQDYITEGYVGKRIVLFYGNCHTGAVKRYLNTSKEFNERYIVYPLKEIEEVSNPAYFDLPVFKVCDVFIHQSIWRNNRYGDAFASECVIKKIRQQCRIIAIPNLYCLPKCFFPQRYESNELKYKNQTYFFRDKIIDEGLRNGKWIAAIANEYGNYTVDKHLIQEQYEEFIKKVEAREEEWDIKVSNFIEKNISDHVMFYEPNHPTNYLIRYYAESLMHILVGDNFRIDEIEQKMDTFQMPILVDVQKALNLKYVDVNHEIRLTGAKIRDIPMDIEEYVKQYIAAIWTSGEFDFNTSAKSFVLFVIYKTEGNFIKAIRKLKRIWLGQQERER